MDVFLWIFVSVFFCICGSSLSYLDYTGHKIIAVFPRNVTQLDLLRGFMDDPEVDFWVEPTRLLENVTVHLAADTAQKVETKLRNGGLDLFTITDNLQTMIDREREENDPREHLAGRTASFDLDIYHPLDDITAHLDELHKKYPNMTEVIDLGPTFEGNGIHVVKISSGGNDTRPAVWIDAGIHSREWIAPATAIYIINYLLTNYGTDAKTTELVDTYDWYILPVVNPDGYLHTWTIFQYFFKRL